MLRASHLFFRAIQYLCTHTLTLTHEFADTYGAITGISQAVALAKTADYVIVVVSNAEDEGGEGSDRRSIALASDQMQLATSVFTAISGKPGVKSTLMMINGGVMAFDELRDVPPSILDVWMPGVYVCDALLLVFRLTVSQSTPRVASMTK